MREKEPKFMRDLHKVREKLGKRWRKLHSSELIKEINTLKVHKPKQKAA